MSRADFLAFRKSLGRTLPLERMTVRARGLDFAVWTSEPVGTALPLLLVNGGMLYDHALLWPALSPLAAGRQVILYDQRGRGASQAPPDPVSASIEDDAEDIGALRRALGIRRWDVLGHSWGGGIAMLATAREPATVRRLITVNAVGPTSDWMAPLHALALTRLSPASQAELERLAAFVTTPSEQLQGEYAQTIYPAWFADRDFATYFTPPDATSITGAAILARLRRDGYDWHERISALSMPVLVTHGLEDALSPAVASQLAALIPDSAVEMIPNAGHMPFWEAPERFFRVTSAFLDV